MRDRGEAHAARPWLWLAAAACALAVVCTMTLWRPWLQTSVPVAGGEQPLAAGAELLTLDDGARVLVFGDSWVYGSAAIVPELGFAYRLGNSRGWQVFVDGVRGSGYLKPGIDGPAYGERITTLDPQLAPSLILVEGSINDRRKYSSPQYRDAVNAAWDDLVAIYPAASIVILGPAPQILPVEEATAAIDRDLADLAAQRGWWYISPIRENWISAENYLDVIDTGAGNNHPSTAGHAYLAERVMGALDAITAPSEVVADAPASPTPIVP